MTFCTHTHIHVRVTAVFNSYNAQKYHKVDMILINTHEHEQLSTSYRAKYDSQSDTAATKSVISQFVLTFTNR